MKEYNYLSDNELERLIADIEENDIVKAPPHIKQEIIERIDKRKQIIEYKRFRNRVIASVAAIIILSVVTPSIKQMMPINISMVIAENNLDLRGQRLLSNFGNTHYISDLLNRRED